jgi:hypothetical protein
VIEAFLGAIVGILIVGVLSIVNELRQIKAILSSLTLHDGKTQP